jgi:hypothetical protein
VDWGQQVVTFMTKICWFDKKSLSFKRPQRHEIKWEIFPLPGTHCGLETVILSATDRIGERLSAEFLQVETRLVEINNLG